MQHLDPVTYQSLLLHAGEVLGSSLVLKTGYPDFFSRFYLAVPGKYQHNHVSPWSHSFTPHVIVFDSSSLRKTLQSELPLTSLHNPWTSSLTRILAYKGRGNNVPYILNLDLVKLTRECRCDYLLPAAAPTVQNQSLREHWNISACNTTQIYRCVTFDSACTLFVFEDGPERQKDFSLSYACQWIWRKGLASGSEASTADWIVPRSLQIIREHSLNYKDYMYWIWWSWSW
jgi:hypothetical protein